MAESPQRSSRSTRRLTASPRPVRDEHAGGAVAWPVNGGPRTVAPRPRRGADDLVDGPAPAPSLADEKTQVVRTVRHRLSGRARLAVLVGPASLWPTPTRGPGRHALLGEESPDRCSLAGARDADRGHLYLDFAQMAVRRYGQTLTPWPVCSPRWSRRSPKAPGDLHGRHGQRRGSGDRHASARSMAVAGRASQLQVSPRTTTRRGGRWICSPGSRSE